MKILSRSTESLCKFLLALDPLPDKLVIGRLVAGPHSWFHRRNIHEQCSDGAWDGVFYEIVENLSSQCQIEHFAASPHYHHESKPSHGVVSGTCVTDQGVLYKETDEPYRVEVSRTALRGDLGREKVLFWLENWDRCGRYFHACTYVLWYQLKGEPIVGPDRLFHYKPRGMELEARKANKGVRCVVERCVTEAGEAQALLKMFHREYIDTDTDIIEL